MPAGSKLMPDNRPLDARLAGMLVYPLRNTAVTPNHLTTLRMLLGIAACVLLGMGTFASTNAGALCFAVSAFLDHADGELARITGNKTKFGHYYDLASDAVSDILLFIGIGIGLSHGALGSAALFMGILAGVSVAGIFQMRVMIGNMTGKDQMDMPNIGLFEIEDVFYLLPLITLFEWLYPFLILAAVGAPAFALLTLRDYLRHKRS